MTFTWDFNTATLVAIASQIVMTIVFMVRTANTAKHALSKAREGIKLAQEAHEKIAILHGQLHLHREQVAREYPDNDRLQQMESRLSGQIDRLGERIDEAINVRRRP